MPKQHRWPNRAQSQDEVETSEKSLDRLTIVAFKTAIFILVSGRATLAAFIKASLLAGSIGFAVLLLANTYVTILLATGFFILSETLLRPTAFSLISKRATTGGQGVAMGLSNSLFDVNVNYPCLSGSLIMFTGFLISLVWVSQGRRKTAGAGPQPVAE